MEPKRFASSNSPVAIEQSRKRYHIQNITLASKFLKSFETFWAISNASSILTKNIRVIQKDNDFLGNGSPDRVENHKLDTKSCIKVNHIHWSRSAALASTFKMLLQKIHNTVFV